MKVKQKVVNGKAGNVLRGPKVPKKMNAPALEKGLKMRKAVLIKNLPKQTTQLKTIQKQVNSATNKPKISNVLPKKSQTAVLGLELGVSSKTVDQAVEIVMELHDEYMKNSKTLLLKDKDFVFLQIVWMKKPEVPEQRRKYLKLRHGLFGEDPEVCLFVNDWKARDHVKRTPDELIEYTVDHYDEFIKTQQIEGISTVMPSYQLRKEYDSYELKRKLVSRFDLFLCQSSLMDDGKFLKHLGIAFNKKNKVPLSLKFPKDPNTPDPSFREKVSDLLRTSWYTLKPHGDTISIRVGNVGHSAEQLSENIIHVLHQLTNPKSGCDMIPGGEANIKSIMLKTSRSKAVPLYINLASPDTVAVPQLPSKRPLFDAIEGELSTQPGKKVSVLPTGEVFVTENSDEELIPDWNDDKGGNDKDESEDEVENGKLNDEKITVKKTVKKQAKKKGKAKVEVKETADDVMSEDSDEDVEAAEEHYLVSRNKAAEDDDESSNDEEKVTIKKGKGKNLGKQKNTVQKKAKEGKRKVKDDVSSNNEEKVTIKKGKGEKNLGKQKNTVQKKAQEGKRKIEESNTTGKKQKLSKRKK